MLGDISALDNVYIVCGRTDMRKQIDGLCAIIEEQLKMNPHENSIFLFCGRKKDRIKAIYREKDGIVLLYKRLTASCSYKWPRNQNEVKSLTWKQFEWLMDDLEIEQPKAIKPPVKK
jgi:transposase